VENPGLEATVQAVETITGLPVHYYAMVNMRGFAQLVDAVGGVTLRVRTEIAIGGAPATSPEPSSLASTVSTARRPSGTPAAVPSTTTTRAWVGRSA
jgi:anionic cell wall polymer biosynthesis LytR-Cps2A-Psr (LCP) family protein